MFDTEVILPMPDTKKFPQPATAPDGLANALPDVPVCDPDCHGEPDIVARLRSDLPDDEVCIEDPPPPLLPLDSFGRAVLVTFR